MSWGEVWRLAMKLFAAEPVELRILIGLALAFLALMILIGLRYAFRPAGPKPELHLAEVILPAAAPEPAATFQAKPQFRKVQLLRAGKPAPRLARKITKPGGKPFAPPRPFIRRAAKNSAPLM